MTNPLKELRERMTARATSHLGAMGVEVFGLKEASLEQTIKSKLQANVGAVAYVFAPLVKRVKINQSLIVIDKVELIIRASANPTLAESRGLPDADQMALELLGLFHLWEPTLDGVSDRLFCETDPVREVPHAKFEVRDIFFWCRAEYALRG